MFYDIQMIVSCVCEIVAILLLIYSALSELICSEYDIAIFGSTLFQI